MDGCKVHFCDEQLADFGDFHIIQSDQWQFNMIDKSFVLHAPEADMIAAGINVALAACSHQVTGAILIRTKK
ncbi:MAG: hypothetical protein WDM80_05935 [Limisphaerales bacterium]